jgi:hypothetical protein
MRWGNLELLKIWVQVIIFPLIYDQQIQAWLMFDNDMVTENSQEAGHN